MIHDAPALKRPLRTSPTRPTGNMMAHPPRSVINPSLYFTRNIICYTHIEKTRRKRVCRRGSPDLWG